MLELTVWLFFGALFVIFGACLVALAGAVVSPKMRLDRHQVCWLLVGMLGSAALMVFYIAFLLGKFDFAACLSVTIGALVGIHVWTKYIEDGLELPHNESEIFRSK